MTPTETNTKFLKYPGNRRCTANRDRKSTRLNSSHSQISYAVFCLKKKKSARRPRASLRNLTHASPHLTQPMPSRVPSHDCSYLLPRTRVVAMDIEVHARDDVMCNI